MKEVEIRAQSNMEELTPIQSELTGNFNPPTLEVRGDIYMPGGPGNGEIGQRPEEVNIVSKIEKPQVESHEQSTQGASLKVTPEKIEQARKDWEKFNAGRTLSVGEKGTQEKLIETGASPMPGGSGAEQNGENGNQENIAPKDQAPEIKPGRATWHTQGGDKEINVRGVDPNMPEFLIVEQDGITLRAPISEVEFTQEGGSGGREPPKKPPTETASPPEPEDNGGDESQPEETTEDNGQNSEVVYLGTYSDPELKKIVTGITADDLRERLVLAVMTKRVAKLIESGKVDFQEGNKLLKRLTEIERKTYGSEDEFRGFYLQEADKKIIRKAGGPQEWLDLQFDILYDLTQEGQEMSSPMISNMQTLAQEASRYITQEQDRKIAKNFEAQFTIRLNLMQMRTAMGYKDIESVKGAAYKLGVHGLFTGMALEEGRVESMYNRLQELMQSERLKLPEFHLTPELASQMQDKIIAEQLDLADKGGLFEGKTEADIRRAVRTAYDVLVSSQRLGVIVARGKHLRHDEAYLSDPIGPLSLYNWEELLTAKFGLFNANSQEFLKELKLEMANFTIEEEKDPDKKKKYLAMNPKEKEEFGAKLMRDLFKVPDFFSSGWRIQSMLESLEEREEIKNSENFALFMRLKDPRFRDKNLYPDEGKQAIADIWKKIVEYKPDEIVGMFREADPNNEKLNKLYESIHTVDDTLIPTPEDVGKGITTYDKFKDKYAGAIRLLRENGFRQNPPVQINMANLDDEQKAIINRAMGDVGAGDRVQKIFAVMQEYINRDGMVEDIQSGHKFAGMLERTLIVDDALLHKMEDTEGGKYTALSKKYSNEQGGDSLVRSWNDHENGAKALQALVGFIQHGNDPEKNQKFAEEFAEFTSQYNGMSEKARAYRFTRGTYLKLARQNIFVDALGFVRLPFRIKTSPIQRIFGPETITNSIDESRAILDHEQYLFVGSVKTEELDNPDKVKEAMKFFYDMEKELDVKAKGTSKRRGITFLAWLMVFFGMEINELRKKVMDQK